MAPNSDIGQAAGADQQSENAQPLDNTLSLPHQSISTPIFGFGSSEWNEFIQAHENLDLSAQLPQANGMDPYIGFDIPFWLGQDQYWDMLHDRN